MDSASLFCSIFAGHSVNDYTIVPRAKQVGCLRHAETQRRARAFFYSARLLRGSILLFTFRLNFLKVRGSVREKRVKGNTILEKGVLA
jgi:hypothetical protein